MNLFRLHRHAVTGLSEKPRHGWRLKAPSIEDVRENVLRRIRALSG